MLKKGLIGPTDVISTTDFASPHIMPLEFQRKPQAISQPTQRVNFDNLDYYKNQWSNNNVAILEDFFDDYSANTVWEYYYNKSDYDYDFAIFPDHFGHYEEGVYPLHRCKPDDPSIPERMAYSLKINDEGGFSYFYRRTEDYHPLLRVFSEDWFIKKLEYITGYQDLKFTWDMTFVSNYGPGHYNGPHTDGMNGRIAFVFHLSKDWKPWNGGLFLRMNDDWSKTTAIVTPSFNKFTMFNVFGDGYGAPHLVTEVAQGCTNRRISYTGWYQ